MNVSRFLLNDIKPLSTADIASDILDLMEELKFSHLALVDADKKYLGLVSEDDLLEIEVETSPISKHTRLLKPYFVLGTSNLFEAIKVIGEGNLSLLPVIMEDGTYLGYLSPLELMQDLGRQLTFTEQGSALVLEIPTRDYQLSQIAQIIESEDARIIGFHLTDASDDDKLQLALKINQKDLSRILQSLERYNYNVVEVFHESLFDDTIADRYESLMKYINM
jgi:CBS domain-containing protein